MAYFFCLVAPFLSGKGCHHLLELPAWLWVGSGAAITPRSISLGVCHLLEPAPVATAPLLPPIPCLSIASSACSSVLACSSSISCSAYLASQAFACHVHVTTAGDGTVPLVREAPQPCGLICAYLSGHASQYAHWALNLVSAPKVCRGQVLVEVSDHVV